MPTYDYLKMKEQHPEWIWPRSDLHAVLGYPGSEECYKTWVEPGNSFSPGICSFGVSIWIYDKLQDKFYIPETMPVENIEWSFEQGYVPVSVSGWKMGTASVRSRLFKQEDKQQHSYNDSLTVELTAEKKTSLTVYLVIRSYGACGGYVDSISLAENHRDIIINGFPLVVGHEGINRFSATDHTISGEDIGKLIVTHRLHGRRSAYDEMGWTSAAAEYYVELDAGGKREFSWDFPIYLARSSGASLVKYHSPGEGDVREREKMVIAGWKEMLGKISIDVPDRRFRDAFYCQLAHILMMISGDDVLIQSSFYPSFWTRDGVYIINVLEKSGHKDLAQKALKRVVDGDFHGGFGAEADAPGEGIWGLTEHYRFSRDKEWLKDVYFSISRKAALIEKMMNTNEDLYDYSTEMVASHTRASMLHYLYCKPPENGLVKGVTDFHSPLYWINCWCLCGLQSAAFCAGELGLPEDEKHFTELAAKLKAALSEYYPRDFVERGIYSCSVSVWPTHAFDAALVKDSFDEWWDKERCPGGVYNVAYDWANYEAGQGHNYLLLGCNEKFNTILERFLSLPDIPMLYVYNEGKHLFDKRGRHINYYGKQDWGYGNILQYKGWDRFDCNMPHNWIGAEVFLMMRDALLYEEDDRLVIGMGIPKAWIEANGTVSIKNAPTYFGDVSYSLEFADGKVRFAFDGKCPPGGVWLRLTVAGVNALFMEDSFSAEMDYCL